MVCMCVRVCVSVVRVKETNKPTSIYIERENGIPV